MPQWPGISGASAALGRQTECKQGWQQELKWSALPLFLFLLWVGCFPDPLSQ
jgi:hypothetical protein